MEQVPLQPLTMVCIAPDANVELTGACPPSHVIVTVEGVVPPLYASSCTNRRGVTNVKLALITVDELNERLFEVNDPHGDERYQTPLVFQSMTPVGYCPVSG